MKRSVATTILVLLCCSTAAWAQDAPKVEYKPAPVVFDSAPAEPLKLSSEQTLKADLFKAKVEIAQLRATVADRESRIASLELSAEQASLAAEFLKTLNAPPGATWDWAKMEPIMPTITDTPSDANSMKLTLRGGKKEN